MARHTFNVQRALRRGDGQLKQASKRALADEVMTHRPSPCEHCEVFISPVPACWQGPDFYWLRLEALAMVLLALLMIALDMDPAERTIPPYSRAERSWVRVGS